MTDTYEFLKEQKEAIIASQKDKRHEFANDVIRRHERIREAAPMLLEALRHYANHDNWTARDSGGIARLWLEPGSETREQYDGYDIARAAIAAATGEQA